MNPLVLSEYNQWCFTRGLYDIFFSSLNRQENIAATGCFQHWLLNLQQIKNVSDSTLPLFPPVTKDHPVYQKFRNLMLEKRLVSNSKDATRIINKMITEIEQFRNKRCKEGFGFSKMELKHIETNPGESSITLGNFHSNSTERINFLINKFGLESTTAMLLRYESIGNNGYQWGDPMSVHEAWYREFHVRYEGFASPLNSRFIPLDGAHFCSVFRETDEVFGSLGNFLDIDFMQHPGGWTANPPFIETLMESVARKILAALEAGAECYFFVCFPTWTDSPGWVLLNESREFTSTRFHFYPGEYRIQTPYSEIICPRNKITHFVVGKIPEGCPSQDRVREIVLNYNM